MSTRGINFLDRWLANNVPGTTKADVISVDELTHKLIADAKAIAPSAGRLMKRSTASIARSTMSSSTTIQACRNSQRPKVMITIPWSRNKTKCGSLRSRANPVRELSAILVFARMARHLGALCGYLVIPGNG